MQVLVVGAGVVGLAVARAAALAGHEVIVAEAAARIGTGVSSRNSEVIHAGLYYPTGSLRAYHCPRGRRMLYEFCASHGVPHRKCGKLVVATSEAEIERLERYPSSRRRSTASRASRSIDAAAAKRLEPELACVAAHAFAGNRHHRQPRLHAGAARRSRGSRRDDRVQHPDRAPQRRCRAAGRLLSAAASGSRSSVDAVVNCAGLGAQRLARATEGYPPERVPRLVLAKGNYFGFAGRPAFSRLIYPVPVPGGLGVHVTLDLAGRMRFGPGRGMDRARELRRRSRRARRRSTPRIRDYWPALPDGSLVPDYAGIRPKLTRPGRAGGGFPDRRAGAARPAAAGPSVRDRVAGAHLARCRSPRRSPATCRPEPLGLWSQVTA